MPENKPPRARTRPPADRDMYDPKHPHPSVTSGASGVVVAGEWANDTGNHEPITSAEFEDTPVGTEILDAQAELRLRTRIKETNSNTREIKETSAKASSGVETLRTEMNGHVERIDGSIVVLSSKVDTLVGHVVEAMGSVNNAVSALNEFQGVVVENQLERSRVTFEAHTAVAQSREILANKDSADARKQRRSFWYRVGSSILKILAGGGVVLATAIATHYAERC